MKHKKALCITLLLVILTSVTLAWWLDKRKNPSDPGEEKTPLSSNRLVTATPQQHDFAETCQWFGQVHSRIHLDIVALEPGRIDAILAQDESSIKKGQTLFTLGGPLVDSRRTLLTKQADTLQQRLALTTQIVARKEKSVAEQLAPYQDLATAKETLADLQIQYEAIEQAQQRLEHSTNLLAAVDGVFTGRTVAVGQEVQQGQTLGQIISPQDLYVEATLFPRAGDAELEGKHTQIQVPGGNTISGSITRVLPQRTDTGASIVWVEGPTLATTLRSGQSVTGTVILSAHDQAIAIVQNALVRDEQERAYVFLKDASGIRKVSVETGLVSDGWVEIVAGLAADDSVVVQGAYELFFHDFNKMYRVAD